MPNIWFTADTHFGHCNIIRYCSRPWTTHEEMNEGIISRFLEVLRPGDTLYHLGDVAHSAFPVKAWLDRMPPIQVHLIHGNHDKPKLLRHPKIVWAGDLKSLHFSKVSTELCHYPMRSWKSKSHGGYHLFGHCHGSLPPLDRSLDVGVDTHNYYPYSWDEIYTSLKDVPIFSESTSGDNHCRTSLSEEPSTILSM